MVVSAKEMRKRKRQLWHTVIFLTVIMVAHLTFISYWEKDAVEDSMMSIANMNTQTLSERLTSDTQQLEALLAILENNAGDHIRSQGELEKVLKTYRIKTNFSKIGIADENGDFYGKIAKIEGNISERAYFKYALEGKTTLESFVEPGKLRKMNIGIPVHREGKICGVMVGSYRVDDLDRLLSNKLEGYQCYSYIVRKDGGIVCSTDKEHDFDEIGDMLRADKNQISERNLKKYTDAVRQNRECSVNYKADGEKRVLYTVPVTLPEAYTTIGAKTWNLVLDIPMKFISEETNLMVLESLLVILINVYLMLRLLRGYLKTQKEANELLEEELKTAEKIANYDVLTGSFNRRYMEREINRVLKEKEHSALLQIDLDNFKKVNDTLGHQRGDEVLKKFARIFDALAEKYGGFAGRIGGDEFVCCLPKCDREKAEKMARMLISQVAEGFEEDIKKCCLGVSVGIALSEGQDEDYDELSKYADAALYIGKRNGKNTAVTAKDREKEYEKTEKDNSDRG